MNKNFILFVFFVLFAHACKDKTVTVSDEHVKLLEDKVELENAYRLKNKIQNKVIANIETDPVDAGISDDAADDPAIWFNRAAPSESIIFGSNKKGGLVAYDLEGRTKQYYPVGNVNNVDVAYGFPFNGSEIDILGCSNRSTQGVDIFHVKKDGSLINLSEDRFLMDTTVVDDIYGFCFGESKDGNYYVFINGKNGVMHQYVMDVVNGLLELELVREIKFDSQPEGMVVSYDNQKLYVGEEQKGIWLLDINPSGQSKTLIQGSGEENQNIKYDIEGLTIMKNATKEWLVASSQGNFSYAIFDIADEHKYLGSFVISDGDTIDGADETDGIDVITDSLSVNFPQGLFVAQDGFNFAKDKEKEVQNFKYVDLRKILNAFN